MHPYFKENPKTGFTQDYINELINDQGYSLRKQVPLFWPTDVYGHGDCLRSYSGWSEYLPISVYMDHGVCVFTELEYHEIRNAAIVHLTWVKHRWSSLRSKSRRYKKYIHRIAHPFVLLSHSPSFRPHTAAKSGTLLFPPHSTGDINVTFDIFDWYKSIRSVINPPEPICICIHPLDIAKGNHLDLLSLGIPVVTAGNSRHPLFARRFLSLVHQFSHTISANVGSELFFSSYVGNTHLLFGEEPQETISRSCSAYAQLTEETSSTSKTIVARNCIGAEGKTYLKHVKQNFSWPHSPTDQKVRQKIVADGLALNYIPKPSTLFTLFLVNCILLIPVIVYRYLQFFISRLALGRL